MMEHKDLIAARFCLLLLEEIGDENFEKMAELNASETDPMICHSHDFCDANMPMLAAFKSVMGRCPNLQDQTDLDLINAAWDHAKAEYLTKKGNQT